MLMAIFTFLSKTRIELDTYPIFVESYKGSFINNIVISNNRYTRNYGEVCYSELPFGLEIDQMALMVYITMPPTSPFCNVYGIGITSHELVLVEDPAIENYIRYVGRALSE